MSSYSGRAGSMAAVGLQGSTAVVRRKSLPPDPRHRIRATATRCHRIHTPVTRRRRIRVPVTHCCQICTLTTCHRQIRTEPPPPHLPNLGEGGESRATTAASCSATVLSSWPRTGQNHTAAVDLCYVALLATAKHGQVVPPPPSTAIVDRRCFTPSLLLAKERDRERKRD